MFIKNYIIKDGKIVLSLGTGEKYIVDYSEQNMNKVLEIMKRQVEFGRENFGKYKNRSTLYYVLSKLISIPFVIAGTILLSYTFYGSFSEVLTPLFGLYIPAAVCFSSFALLPVLVNREKKYTDIYRDVEKNAIFLDISEELNKNLQNNPNLISGMSKKGTKKVESLNKNKTDMTLHSLDGLSLEDLKQLRDNLLRDKEFGFDTGEDGAKRIHLSNDSKPKF